MKKVSPESGLIFGALFFLMVSHVAAEEKVPSSYESGEILDEEKVTTLAPKLKGNFFKSRATYDVEKDVIDRSPSLAKLLDGKPGVQLQETNRGGGTVFIRGLIGPENLILIDGLRFNQSTFRTGPNQYLDTVGLSAVSEISAVNGPAGLLFGSNAIGGVINIKTNRKLADQHSASANLGFDTARSSVFGLFKGTVFKEKTTLRLGINYGQEGMLHAGEGPFLTSGLKENGDFLGNDFQRLGWSLGLNSKPDDNVELTARYLFSSVQNAPRLDRIGEGRLRVADNDDHFGYLRTQILGPKYLDTISIAVMFHHTNELQRRYRCQRRGVKARDIEGCAKREVDQITRKTETNDRVTTIGFVSSLQSNLFEFLMLDAGVDVYHDQVTSLANETNSEGVVNESQGNFPRGATYTSSGVFALLSWTIYSDLERALELQGGIRGDLVYAEADPLPGLGALDYTHVGPVGSLNFSYVTESHLAWLGWHQGFRPPNLQETTQLGDTGSFFEIPNDTLLPERSNSFEIGSRYDHKWFGSFGGSVFLNLINNKITRRPSTFDGQSSVDEKEVRQRINEGDAYYYGLEGSYESKPFYHLSFNASASVIEAAVSNQTQDANFNGGILHGLLQRSDFYQHARRLPPLAYRLGLKYKRSRFETELWMAGNGAQRDLSLDDRKDFRICEISPGVLSQDCNGSDDWATLNLRGRYRFEKIDFALGINNLLNTQYRRHGSGVPGSGLGISGSLRLSI